MEYIRRFLQLSNQSFFLFGPRGTGKSTWIRETIPEALVIDLLAPETHRSYLARPERLRDIVDAQPANHTVVIDEIQKVPQMLDVVHQLLETRPTRRYILTGSSARKLKRIGIDLLAGRALVKSLHPFMAAELGGAFSLENALKLGTVPLVLSGADPEETLKAYAGLYLREEV